MYRMLRGETFFDEVIPVVAVWDDKPGEIRPHCHDFIEIAVVCAGTATVTSENGRVDVQRGSVDAWRPGEWHDYQNCRQAKVLNIMFGEELFERELGWLRSHRLLGRVVWPTGRQQWPTQDREYLLGDEALQLLIAHAEPLSRPARPGTGEDARRIGGLLNIIGEIADAFPERKHTPPPSVRDTITLLENDLAHRWTLRELATRVGISPSHLGRLFAQHLGQSPLQCLDRLRAERTAALLIETELPIAAIGATVGWTDPAYVSRRFRTLLGMNPREYRKRFRPPRAGQ